jgi:ABC-2 type transport system ATP-binding protein
MNAIAINGLCKSYRTGFWHKDNKAALKNLTLHVDQGEVFGCLGPNGAGKTTTLKLLMGLVFPSSGTMQILGMDSQDPRVKSKIGFLPEQPYFYDYLTAMELLVYYAQLSGIPAGERAERALRMLDRVGMKDSAHVQLRKFSKGMLQRTGIAQAILHDPEIVFLDEPMSGLDPIGRREVRDLIQELKDEGKTIFFSTHILSDAESLCDRVAVMNLGELKGVAVVAELVAQSSGNVEVLWNGAHFKDEVVAMGGEIHAAGKSVRAVVPESKVHTLLEMIRNGNVLVSVNPVRKTVEDFFLQNLQPSVDTREVQQR